MSCAPPPLHTTAEFTLQRCSSDPSSSSALFAHCSGPRRSSAHLLAPPRLLHGRLCGGRASGYLGERGQPPQGAALQWEEARAGRNPSGQEYMRAPICPRKRQVKATTRRWLAGRCPFVVVTRHHPLLLRVCVLSGTATSGAARTVVYILFPILPPGGASKPRTAPWGARGFKKKLLRNRAVRPHLCFLNAPR